MNDVWVALARLEDIVLWSEAVQSARCDGPARQGVGARRTCRLRGGITIAERWTVWEEGRSFTYEGTGLPLVERAINTWSVAPQGQNTLLSTCAQVTTKGGAFGRLLEPLFAMRARRLSRRSLAAFTHLVEHGTAPPAGHSRLPAPLASC